ncbi:hypothetical protein [Amycolatopsis suaedae]|uniref:Uncharacterized protein n=1 Tax=Amycolatopsis suaedae TaxID=2510978 RepID=A0A4Q7IYD8_9PSEU|nr:hypothetical protein [Amycolatopsis suaedae]RZQ59459.1 hypothetical protein EWH70_34080 [Amycolatopsis suaedae]
MNQADNIDNDPVREQGPPTVWEGAAGAPALLVLDPAGAANHEGLPASWRDVTTRRQVVWFRLPTDGALSAAEEMLTDPSALGGTVDLLASGPAAGTAVALAGRHADTVRSLLLVDPEEEPARIPVDVRVVAHSTGGPRDRVPPPLPLGHPDVVAAVERTLAELDA